jgi:hypothetical protein
MKIESSMDYKKGRLFDTLRRFMPRIHKEVERTEEEVLKSSV